MALRNMALGSKSRIFSNAAMNEHRVLLVRSLRDNGRSYFTSLTLTPKLAADAGISPTSRVALYWEDQQRLIVLKMLTPTRGRPPQTRKPRFGAADVVQISVLGWVSPELEALYFPDHPTYGTERYQADARPRIVPTPDGNEIHIHPLLPHGTQPDPEDDEIEFGVN